jgi:anti-anti-sigma regulatory factor
MSSATIVLDSLIAKASFQSIGLGSNLSLHFDWDGEVLILRIAGTSSDPLPDSFANAVTNLCRTIKTTHAAIDLTACQSLPSVILAFLVFFQKTVEEHGAGKVVMFAANPRIRTVIKMIGMQDFFSFEADEATTRRAWAPPK